MSELLPGLEDKVALLCVARVPRIYHSALRAVNKTWRETVGSKVFYIVRKQLGVTDESVFLINKFDRPPSQLHCMEIDLKTRKCSKALFVNNAITQDIFNEGYGLASVGHLVLFFGGQSFSENHTPSGTVHVFNTLSRKWTRGADMRCPRGGFCHGVIADKLYVAGGYGGRANVQVVTEAEVYDAEADSWSLIASMPLAMSLDIFYVWRNKLLVRGVVDKKHYVFSYSPASNEWKEEKWLVNLLSSFKPLISRATGVISKRDDSLHVGFAEQSYLGRIMEDYVSVVKVMKLDNKTLKWKKLCEYRDETDEDSCECEIDVAPPLNIFGLKERVLVMNHYDGGRPFKLVHLQDMVKLYLECPSTWSSTIVDA